MEHRKRQHTIKQGRSGSRLGAGSRPCPCECLRRCVYRRIAGAGVIKHELLERIVLNSGAGALVGLAASLVLSRGRTARWAITFFGAGTGVGMAVERSSAEMSAAEREK